MKSYKKYLKIIKSIAVILFLDRKYYADKLCEMKYCEGDYKYFRFPILDKENKDLYAMHDDVVVEIKICE